ncbi:hypothetical protein N431DRAFT_428749 [Stipitochalara longipes BDJ]|nr:hypothetical protein N431DRAFT_428749 [Stipitochalara longipes BDJ]
MSFGYAVGDFVLLTQLAWDVVQNSRKACGAHDELTSEVKSLHIVLRRLEVEVSKPNSILTRTDDGGDRREELAQLSGDCRRVLRILDGILEKYNALSEEKRSVTKLWKRVQFGNGEMLDLADLRLKISTSTSALTLFLNLLSIGSQGKVESYMETQGDELREMRRSLNWITAEMQAKAPKAGEGSILTTYAGDDKAIWKDFRRGLIKEGFSSEVLQRHKETIKDYVMELGSRGALDDLDDDMSATGLPSAVLSASNRMVCVTKEDEVETSESRLSEESKESSDKVESDTGEPQAHTEQLSPAGAFSFKEDEPGFDNSDPKLSNNPHKPPDPLNHTQTSLDDGEPTMPNDIKNDIKRGPMLDSQTDKDSDTAFHETESVSEIKFDAPFDMPDETEESIRPTFNTSDEPVVSLHFAYNPDCCNPNTSGSMTPETWFGMTPKWFGPYRGHRRWAHPWHSLRVTLEDPLFTDETGDTKRYVYTHYRPFRLCHWVVSLSRWYDQIQASNLSLSTCPKMFSPLAEELLLLVARVSAYSTRINERDATKEISEIVRFRDIFESFYLFIRGGIRYMLACNQNVDRKSSADTLWILDDNLGWQQGIDVFVTKRVALDRATTTQSLYKLDTVSSINFLHGLFQEENNTSTSSYAIHSIGSNPLKPLVAFLPELQLLLVYFKRWCEDKVLLAEPNMVAGILHTISEYEMKNSHVVNAVYELKLCNIALETWSFQNDYHKIDATISSFSRHENSLSAILERCDEAQEKLYNMRRNFRINRTRPPPARGNVSSDKARTKKREDKKKR